VERALLADQPKKKKSSSMVAAKALDARVKRVRWRKALAAQQIENKYQVLKRWRIITSMKIYMGVYQKKL
jgi:hypothetical protein